MTNYNCFLNLNHGHTLARAVIAYFSPWPRAAGSQSHQSKCSSSPKFETFDLQRF